MSDLFTADPSLEDSIAQERALRLARKDDPSTSKIAAARAKRFRFNHEDMIVGALGLPGTAHDIARRTGLDYVQVDRRMKQLIVDGRVRVLEQTKPSPSGVPCRVYDQVTTK